jgi:hypothetical protein
MLEGVIEAFFISLLILAITLIITGSAMVLWRLFINPGMGDGGFR